MINTIIESKDADLSKLASKELLSAVEKDILALKHDVNYIKQDVGFIKQNFATKDQLALVEKDIVNIKQDISTIKQNYSTKEQVATLEERLTAQIKSSENSLLKWIIPFFLALISLMATIIFRIFAN